MLTFSFANNIAAKPSAKAGAAAKAVLKGVRPLFFPHDTDARFEPTRRIPSIVLILRAATGSLAQSP